MAICPILVPGMNRKPSRKDNTAMAGHQPIRTCVVCGAKRAKDQLRRLALDDRNHVVVDPRQRMNGRGAYACADCLDDPRLEVKIRRAFRGRAVALAMGNRDAVNAD